MALSPASLTLTDIFADVDVAPVTGVLSGVLADNGGPVATIALNPDVANPAIDTGDPAALDETHAGIDLNGDGDQTDTITTDARGFDRTSISTARRALDLGAFEQQAGASFVVTTLEDELDSLDPNATLADFGGADDLSLREALALAEQDPTSFDTITFDDDLIGGVNPGVDDGMLVLSQGELAVFGNVTIDGDVNGDDTPDITVDGAGASTRVPRLQRHGDAQRAHHHRRLFQLRRRRRGRLLFLRDDRRRHHLQFDDLEQRRRLRRRHFGRSRQLAPADQFDRLGQPGRLFRRRHRQCRHAHGHQFDRVGQRGRSRRPRLQRRRHLQRAAPPR